MKSTAAPNIRSSGQALSCLPLNSNVENITANSTSMKSTILTATHIFLGVVNFNISIFYAIATLLR
jgi:hypothetical protein